MDESPDLGINEKNDAETIGGDLGGLEEDPDKETTNPWEEQLGEKEDGDNTEDGKVTEPEEE